MEDKKDIKYFSTTFNDEENELVEELVALTGLNKATAVKLHLRQTLPAKLKALRADANSSVDSTPKEVQGGQDSKEATGRQE